MVKVPPHAVALILTLTLIGEGATTPSSEGTRIVDMARAVITSSMSMWVGMRPNYGDGSNYWSVNTKDGGSLRLNPHPYLDIPHPYCQT